MNRIENAFPMVETPTFSESFHKAHLRANLRTPQNFKLIDFSTTSALLLDPPKDWVAFASSRRTDNQLDEFGNAMNIMHIKHKIPYLYGDLYKTARENIIGMDVHEVTKDRLHQLGQRAIYGALTRIAQVTSNTPPIEEEESLNHGVVPILPISIPRFLQEFYDDPKNAGKIHETRQSAAFIKTLLASRPASLIYSGYKEFVLSRDAAAPFDAALEETTYFLTHRLQEVGYKKPFGF